LTNKDKRVRECIEAAENYLESKITLTELRSAYVAAYDTAVEVADVAGVTDVAYAAYVAASAATYADVADVADVAYAAYVADAKKEIQEKIIIEACRLLEKKEQ
jgi:hypothetical protein